MNLTACTCHAASRTATPGCPIHDLASRRVERTDLHGLLGLRSAPLVAEALGEVELGMIAADHSIQAAIGRVVSVDEPIMLRPAGDPGPAPEINRAYLGDWGMKRAPANRCACDIPSLFGHDTGCVYHPAPIAPEPLQLLLSASQLIPDQPTTEQWQTIKKAIQAFADLEPTARS